MLRVGVGGYPPSYSENRFGKDRMKIFEWLRSLGLDAFEAMMTYGPRTTAESCRTMKTLSSEFDVKVSVHASYYIVLTSSEKEKVARSIDMLKRTFELTDMIGGDTVVLYPGSLYGKDPMEIMEILGVNLTEFFYRVGDTRIGLFLETAGKKAQFGSVEEILSVTDTIGGCYPCIDFGHVHARGGGELRTVESIDNLFAYLKNRGAFKSTGRIHFHYTPIHYGAKGEIQHRKVDDIYTHEDAAVSLMPEQSGNLYLPRYDRIIENIYRENIPATIISETHNSQDKGALAMKLHFDSLRPA